MKQSQLIAGEPIHQVVFKQIDEKKDDRGSFSEIFQNYWKTPIKPVQWSVVKSNAGVFRGMHFHKRHDEYFSLLSGHCLVGLKDIRPNSPTEGIFSLYELHEKDMAAIIFPRGLLHGWYFYESSVHLQSVSEAYADYAKNDNLGCHWNAPDLDIPWPMKEVILSKRSQDFKTVAAVKTNQSFQH